MGDNPAMAAALALFAAAGRADHIARDMTRGWFSPPRQNLIRLWLMYAWASREAPQHLEWARHRMRRGIAAYRMLREGT